MSKIITPKTARLFSNVTQPTMVELLRRIGTPETPGLNADEVSERGGWRPSAYELQAARLVVGGVFVFHDHGSINRQNYVHVYWHRAGHLRGRSTDVTWSIGDAPRKVHPANGGAVYIGQNSMMAIFRAAGLMVSTQYAPGGSGQKGLVAANRVGLDPEMLPKLDEACTNGR